MVSNIVITGGATKLLDTQGMQQTLYRDGHVPSTVSVKVVAPPEAHISPWIGGSIFGSLSTFEKYICTAKQYEDFGAAAVECTWDTFMIYSYNKANMPNEYGDGKLQDAKLSEKRSALVKIVTLKQKICKIKTYYDCSFV